MKKLLSVLLCLIMVMSILTIIPSGISAVENELADTGDDSGVTGDCTWKVEGTVLTISGNGKMGDYYHKSGGELSPWRYKKITEAIVKPGVTYIGNYAFADLDFLEKVSIPNSVTSIGDHAFYFSRNITTVSIPDSVTTIGDHAFYACKGLTGVKLPASLTEITPSLFYSCSSLKSFSIPYGVTSIGTYAFYQCTSLEIVSIPDSVTTIDDHAFANCPELKCITIPDSVTTIDEWSLGYQSYSRIAGFTIYGTAGSAAEKYAKDNQFTFIEGTAPAAILGDADLDNTVTILDATAIQRHLAELPNESFFDKAADADRDGGVTILDATEIQRHLAGLPANADIGKLIAV